MHLLPWHPTTLTALTLPLHSPTTHSERLPTPAPLGEHLPSSPQNLSNVACKHRLLNQREPQAEREKLSVVLTPHAVVCGLLEAEEPARYTLSLQLEMIHPIFICVDN